MGVALHGPTGRPTACEEGYGGTNDLSTEGWLTVGPAVVVVVVVVEASVSKVYPMVTLASASTLSVSMLRTLRGE